MGHCFFRNCFIKLSVRTVSFSYEHFRQLFQGNILTKQFRQCCLFFVVSYQTMKPQKLFLFRYFVRIFCPRAVRIITKYTALMAHETSKMARNTNISYFGILLEYSVLLEYSWFRRFGKNYVLFVH